MKVFKIFVLISSLFLSQCYYIKNGYFAGKQLASRRPLQEVVDDARTSEITKRKLLLVQDVLSFAHQDGLNVNGSYEYFIDTGDTPVSYLVSAAYQDELRSYTWWFPIVGTVPYLGFFEEKDRDREAVSLERKGLDVERGSAAAFSGLGWFSDPIFSGFLAREDALLADLIFHELVHRTVWIPNQVVFNEQLAEFVAEELTTQYLRVHSLVESERFFEAYRQDQDRFHEWLHDLRRELEELFEKRRVMSLPALLEKKKEIYSRYTQSKRPSFARFDFVGDEPWNNAKLLASDLYSPNREKFSEVLHCGSFRHLGDFLLALKEWLSSPSAKGEEPLVAMLKFCPSPGVKLR